MFFVMGKMDEIDGIIKNKRKESRRRKNLEIDNMIEKIKDPIQTLYGKHWCPCFLYIYKKILFEGIFQLIEDLGIKYSESFVFTDDIKNTIEKKLSQTEGDYYNKTLFISVYFADYLTDKYISKEYKKTSEVQKYKIANVSLRFTFEKKLSLLRIILSGGKFIKEKTNYGYSTTGQGGADKLIFFLSENVLKKIDSLPKDLHSKVSKLENNKSLKMVSSVFLRIFNYSILDFNFGYEDKIPTLLLLERVSIINTIDIIRVYKKLMKNKNIKGKICKTEFIKVNPNFIEDKKQNVIFNLLNNTATFCSDSYIPKSKICKNKIITTYENNLVTSGCFPFDIVKNHKENSCYKTIQRFIDNFKKEILEKVYENFTNYNKEIRKPIKN